MTRILVTGGAGFIGSHLVDILVDSKSNNVTILDLLEPQVHGENGTFPSYLNQQANLIKGSVTNYEKLKGLVKENDIVIHLAAIVGVGQSNYQIKKYVYNNVLGMSNLLDILANEEYDIKKLYYSPSIKFCDGIDDLIEWIRPQIERIKDSSQAAINELNNRGLIK